MKTERLYYRDPYTVEFDARVIDIRERAAQPAVVLDRSAFYPTSGGQPFDTGRLGDAAVLEVEEDEEGAIVHVLDRPLEAGAAVHGRVDWDRRFDHMQQHTGQHVLSAAFARLDGVATVSFHLGSAASTIDLARQVTAAEIERAESEANKIVWQDRAVAIRFASPEEAARMPLRKEPVRSGDLRLIDVQDFDLSACGGTHVARTGAIGIIAVSGAEKFKGMTRVTFVCGGRALRQYRELKGAVDASLRHLSVTVPELAGAIERQQAELREARKSIRDLQERLAVHEAASLLAGAREIAGVRVVAEAVAGYDAPALKAMASVLAASPRTAAVLVSQVEPALVVVARSPDVAFDASAILRALTASFGGRGGGKPDLAQGGGLTASPGRILDAAVEQIALASG
jgi:alanyl-tRNA synthetase